MEGLTFTDKEHGAATQPDKDEVIKQKDMENKVQRMENEELKRKNSELEAKVGGAGNNEV